MKLINIFAVAALWQSAFGFNFLDMEQKRNSLQLSAAMKDGDSRREFFGKAGATAFSLSSGLSLELLAPLPANAVGGLDKVNAQLKA